MDTIELSGIDVIDDRCDDDTVIVAGHDLESCRAAIEKARKNGEHIGVIDRTRNYFEMTIESIDDTSAALTVARTNDEDFARIVLVQGICERERMRTIVRAAAELGVERFVPLASAWASELSGDDIRELRMLAENAWFQSGARRRMVVESAVDASSLARFCETCDATIVLWEQASDSASLSSAVESALARKGRAGHARRIALVLGPAAGLSEGEVSMLGRCGGDVLEASLGRMVLSCDVAAISALSLVEALIAAKARDASVSGR